MSYPRKGSKIWRGRGKRYIRIFTDTFNRIAAEDDAGVKLVAKVPTNGSYKRQKRTENGTVLTSQSTKDSH